MERGVAAHPLSWLLVLVTGTLVASALTLPLQPYPGMVLQGNRVVSVMTGGPADRAGLRRGDRIHSPRGDASGWNHVGDPLAMATPNSPVSLEVEQGGLRRSVRLTPEPLPDRQRRIRAALILVATGFVLLGGWVWSERRDRLTRPFYLLCLAFAGLLAPVPHFPFAALAALHEIYYAGLTLVLPALIVHFFALFPEPHDPRGRLAAGVVAGYGVAGLLMAAYLLAFVLRALEYPALSVVTSLLQAASALWFAAGLVAAIGLFARSYLRARTPDARRRLRVALIGTVLGLAPFAWVIVVHSLAPATDLPGELYVVLTTLFIPASFAWAIAVHGIFDFAVALRASRAMIVVALVTAVVLAVSEWLGPMLWPGHSAGLLGAALALVALGSALAGPARPWGRTLGARLLALEDPPSLAAAMAQGGRDQRPGDVAAVLNRACEALVAALQLDGCSGLKVTPNGVQFAAASGRAIGPLEPGTSLVEALVNRTGPVAADDRDLLPIERATLDAGGVHWVLPVGTPRPAALLLLGRRLAGPWLGRREAGELERMAGHLAVELENVTLRDAARSLGDRDRELERAGAIQTHLLPRRAPIYPTLDCAAATLSSEAVGGDYYDFVQRTEREFTLVVGDAAGHGVSAALVLAGVQARFRAEAGGGREPSDVLRALNQELVALGQPAKFVGLLCARVDVRRGRIWLANGGLTPPLLRRRDGRCEEVTAGGMLLGVSDQASYRDICIDLGAGDVAVIYTDGLTEARSGGELFGPERVREIVERHAHERASRILDALVTRVRAFADSPLDDLTVLVLKQLADPLPAAP